MPKLILFLGLVHVHTLSALAVKGPLTKALGSTARPVVVHLFDRKAADVEDYAIADVSAACRNAGAAAVLVAPELVRAVAEEQDAHRGDYPGPLPVIADVSLSALVGEGAATADVAACGASAIGIRYYKGDWPEASALEDALRDAVAHAEQSGLSALLLAEFGADGSEGVGGAGEVASRVGAAAALASGGVTDATESECAIELGCWHGGDQDLQYLREKGFGGLVLKDACGGDIALGARESSPSLAAQRVTALVKRALSKSSARWGGSAMFGSTASLDAQKTQDFEQYFERS